MRVLNAKVEARRADRLPAGLRHWVLVMAIAATQAFAQTPAGTPVSANPTAKITTVVGKVTEPAPSVSPPRLKRPSVEPSVDAKKSAEPIPTGPAAMPVRLPEQRSSTPLRIPAPKQIPAATASDNADAKWVSRSAKLASKRRSNYRVAPLVVEPAPTVKNVKSGSDQPELALADLPADPLITSVTNEFPSSPEPKATALETPNTPERDLSKTGEPALDSSVTPVLHHKEVVVPFEDSAPVAPTMIQHIIQIGDELDIAFPYQPVFGDATAQRLQPPLYRTERVVVREDGMIVLPLIEPVVAAGLTPEEVRDELVARYQPLIYDPLANLKAGENRQYRICVNDEIELRIRNQPDLSDVLTVRPDGRISVPRVGEVVAEGKTLEELKSELSESINKIIPDPELSLALRNFHADFIYEGEKIKRLGLKNLEGISVIVRTADRTVYVMGEVKGARQIAYRGTITLNQAIAAAGGTLRTARLKDVKILRRTNPQAPPITMLVDLRSTIRGQGANDVQLHHLDVVVLNKTHVARFTDTLEQYVFNIVPFTRNNPNFNFFYSLGGGAGGAILNSP